MAALPQVYVASTGSRESRWPPWKIRLASARREHSRRSLPPSGESSFLFLFFLVWPRPRCSQLRHRAKTGHYRHPQPMSQGVYVPSGPSGQLAYAPNVVVVRARARRRIKAHTISRSPTRASHLSLDALTVDRLPARSTTHRSTASRGTSHRNPTAVQSHASSPVSSFPSSAVARATGVTCSSASAPRRLAGDVRAHRPSSTHADARPAARVRPAARLRPARDAAAAVLPSAAAAADALRAQGVMRHHAGRDENGRFGPATASRERARGDTRRARRRCMSSPRTLAIHRRSVSDPACVPSPASASPRTPEPPPTKTPVPRHPHLEESSGASRSSSPPVDPPR